MPPPRFVRRSSTSPLRSVSIFSANAGVALAAGEALAAGAAETTGVAEGLTPAISGVGDGVSALIARAGRSGACFAIHHSHATKPMTQRTITIQAVRSIKLA